MTNDRQNRHPAHPSPQIPNKLDSQLAHEHLKYDPCRRLHPMDATIIAWECWGWSGQRKQDKERRQLCVAVAVVLQTLGVLPEVGQR